MDFKTVYIVLVHASFWLVSQQQKIEPCNRWKIEGIRCRQSDECRLVKKFCFWRKCEARPTCVPITSQDDNICRVGRPVLNRRNYTPLTCPVGRRTCPRGTICTSSVRGGPNRCCWIPDRTINPCSSIFCGRGRTCVVQPPYKCDFPPCKPIGLCIDLFFNPCAGKVCPEGEACLVQQNPSCGLQDCTPRGICADPNPCASTLCRKGQKCVIQPEVNCTFPFCKPTGVCVGVCPSFPDLGPGCIWLPTCNADSECSPGIKCCPIGRCGPRCVAPDRIPPISVYG